MKVHANDFELPTVMLPLHVGIALLTLLVLPASLLARLMEGATYEQMYDKADLVVIAKPLSSKDTHEHTMLPGLESIHVVGINTDFESHLVLKGDKAVKRFVLHHYKLNKRLEPLPIINGPTFISFDPEDHHAYLLFLIKEPNGKYAPGSGQVDPAAFSVIKLSSVTE